MFTFERPKPCGYHRATINLQSALVVTYCLGMSADAKILVVKNAATLP